MATARSRRKPSQQRRTPRQDRSRATVSFVLDAAAQVFAERGYAATTNEVAVRAGVSIGSVYQYFADKDALLVAVLDRVRDDLSGAIAALLTAGGVDPPVADRRGHALVVAVDAAIHEHVLAAADPEDEQARIDDVVTLTTATLAAYG